jgi:hypothetical protein
MIQVLDWSNSPRSPYPHGGILIDVWDSSGTTVVTQEYWDLVPSSGGWTAISGTPGVIATAHPGGSPESIYYWTTPDQDREAAKVARDLAATGVVYRVAGPGMNCYEFASEIVSRAGVQQSQIVDAYNPTPYVGPIPAPAPTPPPAPVATPSPPPASAGHVQGPGVCGCGETHPGAHIPGPELCWCGTLHTQGICGGNPAAGIHCGRPLDDGTWHYHGH